MGKNSSYPIEIDGGYVIRDENTMEYFCGLNKWDKQLRKAQIYHSIKYANDILMRYQSRRKLGVHTLIMRVEDVK